MVISFSSLPTSDPGSPVISLLHLQIPVSSHLTSHPSLTLLIDTRHLQLFTLGPAVITSTSLHRARRAITADQSIMARQDSMTAAQTVLSIAELVAEIFYHLGDDTSSLARCTQVNSLWCAEAVRRRWRHPQNRPYGDSLASIFAGIHPDRRQAYANFVKAGDLHVVRRKNIGIWSSFLRGLRFTRLRSLTLYLDLCQPHIYLPRINAPGVTMLRIRWNCIHKQFRPRGIDSLVESVPRLTVRRSIPMKYIYLTVLKKRLRGLKRIFFDSIYRDIDSQILNNLSEELPHVEISITCP